MTKKSHVAILCGLVLAVATGAEARKTNGGNPLGPPTLVSAEQLAAGEAECDGDELTTEDLCVEVTFTKNCSAVKYPVEVSKGFDTDDDGCVDTTISENTALTAETCTGTLNCLGDTAECQTGVVPVGTTTFCVDDGDLVVDCVNDPEDVEVSALSVCTKVKATNPAKKGPKSISQSTEFSNTICSDINDECF
jgi:hypothetical protein